MIVHLTSSCFGCFGCFAATCAESCGDDGGFGTAAAEEPEVARARRNSDTRGGAIRGSRLAERNSEAAAPGDAGAGTMSGKSPLSPPPAWQGS